MKRNSFLFYADWMKSMENLSADIRLQVYESIIDYATTGIASKLDDPVARTAFKFMKTGIDKDIEKYMSMVERNRKNGVSRQAKPVNTGNQRFKKSQSPQPGDDNDIDIDMILKKESTNVDKKETFVSSLTHADYDKFISWLNTHAPYCASIRNFPRQITPAEFDKLKQKYSGKQIADVIEQLENRKDLRKRYINLYRTVLNWAKKAYGN